MPGVPGLWLQEQAVGWKKVVDAVHAKGGFIYCQLWHAGRATIPQMTGSPAVSAFASVWDSPDELYSHSPVGSDERVRYADHPPIELSLAHLKRTIQDYCNVARTAMEIGFDGVELHAGNGYLPEQFLSSNINKRMDEYGGSPEKRCRFVLELMVELAKTTGEENLAIRLSPFGLFNQARGEQRVETWSYLCRQLKETHPRLSYVSFIEPVSSFPILLSLNLPRYQDIEISLVPFSISHRPLPHPALRAIHQFRRKGQSPQILEPTRRRPEQLPPHIRLDAVLFRWRLG